MKTIALQILILSLFFAAVLSAPAADNTKDKTKENTKDKTSDTIKLTVADKAKDVKTVTGKKIEIRLKGNPTTGYSWRLAELKTDVLKADGKETYIADKNDPPRVGSGGIYLFKFITGKPGKATINLEYLRPWEKDTPPAEKFSVTIIVADK